MSYLDALAQREHDRFREEIIKKSKHGEVLEAMFPEVMFKEAYMRGYRMGQADATRRETLSDELKNG